MQSAIINMSLVMYTQPLAALFGKSRALCALGFSNFIFVLSLLFILDCPRDRQSLRMLLRHVERSVC